MTESEQIRKALKRIKTIEISRCVLDEQGLLTLTALNPLHPDDDRNNVIDLEGVTFEEAQQIIAEKHDHSLPDMEMRELLFGIGIVLMQERKSINLTRLQNLRF